MLVFKGSFSFINVLIFLVNMDFTNNPCLRADTHRQALYHFPITQYSFAPAPRCSVPPLRGGFPVSIIPIFHVGGKKEMYQ